MYSWEDWPAIGGTIENGRGKPSTRGGGSSARGEDAVCGGIDAAEGGIAGVEGGDGCRLGTDVGGDADRGGAGSVHGGPEARADAREEGRAVGRAFLGFDNFDGAAVNIGLDLAP